MLAFHPPVAQSAILSRNQSSTTLWTEKYRGQHDVGGLQTKQDEERASLERLAAHVGRAP